ncbi:MAG TPA: gamma-glutamyl-gamma-aminobutyrate hydrolase family protein [Candidatus Dormibacteraeota bacterium]
MTRKPRIGVTRAADKLNSTYVRALQDAGAEVVELAPGADGGAALEEVDGLLFTGGADIDPAEYAAEPHPMTVAAPDRDALELPLVRAALERGTPVLAICRGIQVVNVALGGDLKQHVPEHDHYTTGEPRQKLAHQVRLAADSAVAEVLGAAELPVNSLHHQAVGEVAPALRATGWSEDGEVEAVESPDGNLLAVQWHPEELVEVRPESRRLFEWLVKRAGQTGSRTRESTGELSGLGAALRQGQRPQ